MHGLTHVTGGSDPVPFLPSVAGGDWEGTILGLSGLVGYWRLGEGAPPYLDTSGVSPAADMALATSGSVSAMTQDVTPGLLPEGQDDGAVAFNAAAAVVGDRLYTANSRFGFTAGAAYTAVALIQPGASGNSFYGGIVGDLSNVTGSPNWLGGWGLRLNWPAMTVSFVRGTSASTFAQAESSAVSGGTVYMVAGTYDGTTIRVYVNGTLADSQPDSNSLPSPADLRIGGYNPSASTWAPFYGVIDEVAVFDRALTDDELAGLYGAATTGDGEGLVLGIGEDGNPAWVQPKIEVTVNGEPSAPPATPPAPLPPDPNTGFAGLQWIVDQPFVWGGGSFDVPPNKWTTIPFTSPLMERWSNVTAEGTVMTELAWNDPAAAGWINPDTPRVITIPHDMPFLNGLYDWMQICLRLEGPMVEPTTSYRGLRIFETTHQKTLVSAVTFRDLAVGEGGAADVFRDLDVAWTGGIRADGIFAYGDSSGLDTGNHDTIMFGPTSGAGYHIPGEDWLPRVAGVPTLKQGMRLIPQVWHDAHTTLTFHCDSVAPHLYRPHFVVWQGVDRAWGPPWSDWPLYTP